MITFETIAYVIYLLEDFGNRLEQFDDMPIVCGGDWNLIMENIDKKGGSSVLTHKKNREHLRPAL
jgi:exonuclease III